MIMIFLQRTREYFFPWNSLKFFSFYNKQVYVLNSLHSATCRSLHSVTYRSLDYVLKGYILWHIDETIYELRVVTTHMYSLHLAVLTSGSVFFPKEQLMSSFWNKYPFLYSPVTKTQERSRWCNAVPKRCNILQLISHSVSEQ